MSSSLFFWPWACQCLSVTPSLLSSRDFSEESGLVSNAEGIAARSQRRVAASSQPVLSQRWSWFASASQIGVASCEGHFAGLMKAEKLKANVSFFSDYLCLNFSPLGRAGQRECPRQRSGWLGLYWETEKDTPPACGSWQRGTGGALAGVAQHTGFGHALPVGFTARENPVSALCRDITVTTLMPIAITIRRADLMRIRCWLCWSVGEVFLRQPQVLYYRRK